MPSGATIRSLVGGNSRTSHSKALTKVNSGPIG